MVVEERTDAAMEREQKPGEQTVYIRMQGAPAPGARTALIDALAHALLAVLRQQTTTACPAGTCDTTLRSQHDGGEGGV